MKVFATAYLERMSTETVNEEKWTWKPDGEEAEKIYGSGANTSSKTSTYAAEKDNRSDTDRPNEGLYIA